MELGNCIACLIPLILELSLNFMKTKAPKPLSVWKGHTPFSIARNSPLPSSIINPKILHTLNNAAVDWCRTNGLSLFNFHSEVRVAANSRTSRQSGVSNNTISSESASLIGGNLSQRCVYRESVSLRARGIQTMLHPPLQHTHSGPVTVSFSTSKNAENSGVVSAAFLWKCNRIFRRIPATHVG